MVLPTPKRIKRQVIGRTHTFFAATPPGLESICAQEIATLPVDIAHTTIVSGGVEFEGRLNSCYTANLYLRIPTRILMRLTQFKATNFRQLETMAARFPWELHIPPSIELVFSVKTTHSRLFHTNAIAQRLEASIRGRVPSLLSGKSTLQPSKTPQRLYVRVVDDRVSISLDSSGQLLFKRGLKHNVGDAPIRETLAATILNLSGYDGSQTLLDPMCGSGSFSLEAAMIAKNIPPGFYRRFAFMEWPAFREAHWRHLKQKASAKIQCMQSATIFASDRDTRRTTALKEILDQFELSDAVQPACRDFFTLNPGHVTDKPGLLVLNPPFGVRMQSNGELKKFYADMMKKLASDYLHWQIALLVKDRTIAKQLSKKFKRLPLNHGGIDLVLCIGVFK